jgi:hypothetical protein
VEIAFPQAEVVPQRAVEEFGRTFRKIPAPFHMRSTGDRSDPLCNGR